MTPSIATTKLCLLSLAIAWATAAPAAQRFDASHQPLGSMAPLVLANTDLSSGTVKAYRPWFETGAWQGDLVEYSIGAIGTITTSVDFSGTSPVNTGTPPANWSALVTMAAAEAADTDGHYWRDGRKIITAVSGVQKSFTWNTLEPTKGIGDANMALIDQTAFDANAASSDTLNYIRGDRSNEYPEDRALRPRASALGDIIHSNPTYVAAPNALRTDNDYATWAADKASREPRIYVGANDGMLHAFDAADGSEVYAYIPSMLMSDLKHLKDRPFSHRYYVDGKLTARDAFFAKGGSGTATWHTVLVGALGAGGRGVFALDITDPDLGNENAVTGSDIKLLWEIKTTPGNVDRDLGDSFSRASIAQLNDDVWYAVFGNGYNSLDGEAVLYLVNIGTGGVTKLSTNSGSAASPNGLSSPTLLDADKDGKVDYAYAGDIDGNLWKFDLTTAGSFGAVPTPLHPAQTPGAKAITSAPRIALHPSNGYIVYFATGRLFTQADILDTSVQSMYGIWDSGLTPPDKATQSLLQVNLDAFDNEYTFDGNTDNIGVYNPDVGNVNWLTQHGWQVDFPAGYRVLEAIQLRGARAKVTIHNPTGGERKNALVEASIYNGGAHTGPIFDLSGNGTLDDDDLFDGNGDSDFDDPEDIPMAWQRQNGIMSQVSIARVANGIDTLFLNYLDPPLPCSDCGFEGGHIDVDTWNDGEDFGGYSTKHDHEYDKKTGRVFVDFFDLNVPSGGEPRPRRSVTNQVEINDSDASGIAEDDEFIILVANADFSAGSTFKIGDKTMNVAEYQRQLHLALKAWDATVPDSVPVFQEGPYTGQSLSFNWADIQAEDGGNGTISHNFDNQAIISGGLHPTQTVCVRDGAYDTFDPDTLAGRWRNGALTTQLVKTSHFSSASAIDDVYVQRPDDLDLEVSTNTGDVLLFAEDENDDYYEMGGIIAKTELEHIWESAIFWHFGKLFALVEGNKPCYGEEDWEDAVALEKFGNPFERAFELLEDELEGIDINDLEQELADRLECSGEDESDNSSCKTLYKLLVNLIKLRPDYDVNIPNNYGGDDENLGVGTITPGAATNDGPTAGVEFQHGRASWTDVAPK